MIKIEAIGNLGKDAELKQHGGKDILSFSLAAKGSFKEADTVWLNCSVWGTRAEKLRQYMTKGTRVFIRGEAKVKMWENKGKSGVDVSVNVDEVELLGSPQNDKKQQNDADEDHSPAPPRGDDIPF